MNTQPTPLTFRDIHHLAFVHGLKIRDLAAMLAIHHPCEMDGPLGDYDADEYKAMGETLMGIHAVLTLLAKTPNASVNGEALEAMGAAVRQAEGILAEEWIQEILKDASTVLGRADELEMPF